MMRVRSWGDDRGWGRAVCRGLAAVLGGAVAIVSLAAAEIKVAAYNVENYFIAAGEHRRKIKSEPARQALLRMFRETDADILMLCEVGGEEALRDLAERLRAVGLVYPHVHFMAAGDSPIGLGMLARLAPTAVVLKDDLNYAIRPKRGHLPMETMPVQRGFLHAAFAVDGYRLHVIMAHLKSRLFHPRYHQTDMRRYEARLLRYYTDSILSADPEANLLVVGDLNDEAETDPLKLLRASGRAPERRLYDLRPVDAMGLAWTHWWAAQDVYGRIDYLLASHGILAEICPLRTQVVHLPTWGMSASDHRPVVAVVTTPDRPPPAPAELAARFPGGIRRLPPLVARPGTGLPPSPVPEDPSAPPVLTCGFHNLPHPAANAEENCPDELLQRLRAAEADIWVLANVRDAATLRRLQDGLDAKFAELVVAEDAERRLALVSRRAPDTFTAYPETTYRIKDRDMPVRRGFLHAVFVAGDYRLHIFGAHLKSRRKHPEYNQTDMRRYEGRQLRQLVNQLLKAEPTANILVLGNLNDTCGMSTIKEVYNRRFGIPKRLFDLRPTDALGTSWTNWSPAEDAYERIDYALATAALVPEVLRPRTVIAHDPAWCGAAAHRPLLVTISCRDEAGWSKAEFDAIFPNTIYAAGAPAEEEWIGRTRQRGAADADGGSAGD